MDDGSIIDLYWSRSERAISETDGKYGRYCRYISRHILDDAEDAEECVNDTYLNAWNAIPPGRPDHFAAFLGRITRNLSLNRLKQYHAEKRGAGQVALALSELEECVGAADDVESAMDALALTESLNRFLSAQPEPGRDIFIRRYWYLCSIRDLAEQYGMSESKLTSLLFRIRKALRLHLEKDGIL